jgi:hypothetical protein
MSSTLNEQFEHLLKVYEEEKETHERSNEPMIQVNEVIGYLAFIYDKARNVVEFAEEHVLRKNTIKRVLKRKLIESRDSYEIAGGLLRELVRYRHLENNSVPESKIIRVGEIVARYRAARDIVNRTMPVEIARNVRKILLNTTVAEIDDTVVSKQFEYAFVNFGFSVLNPKISVTGVDESFKSIQVFIAALKSFVKLDDEMLSYHLMGVLYPQWFSYTEDLPTDFSNEIQDVSLAIDAHLHFKLRRRILNNVHKYSAYFVMLRDALLSDKQKLMDLVNNPVPKHQNPFEKKPETLDGFLSKIIQARYALIRSRLVTRSIRAFIYVLATKVIVSLVVEVPGDILLQGHVNYYTLAVNLIFPLILILLLTFTVRMPKIDNTRKLIDGMKSLIYADVESEAFAEEKIVQVTQSSVTNAIFMTLYIILCAAIYGLIIRELFVFDFNIISGFIFLLLTSVICYFAVLIRQPVKQLRVVRQRENVFMFFINLLSLPILQFGRWLSENVSKINVFIYIFDFLIEAPFQIIIEVFENWVEYLRGKREEIY